MTEKQYSTLSKKKSKVPISKTEVIFMLRAYQEHPASWTDIIADVQDNVDHLPPRTKELYRTASTKQLRSRLSGKFNTLMDPDNDDEDIRVEVQKIKQLEARNAAPGNFEYSPITSPPPPIDYACPTAGPSQPMWERYDNLAMPFKSDYPEDFEPPKKVRRKEKKPKKGSLEKAMRKTGNKYTKFITKRVPKVLLRTFGVSTSSSDSDSD